MNSNLENDAPAPAQRWLERGLVVEESWLINPVTGRSFRVVRAHMTMMDPRTGGVVSRDLDFPVQCRFGDIITQPEGLAFCAECGSAVCCRHSVGDPICGFVFCLACSRMIEMNGLTLRICRHCCSAIRAGWLTRAFRRLMGRD